MSAHLCVWAITDIYAVDSVLAGFHDQAGTAFAHA